MRSITAIRALAAVESEGSFSAAAVSLGLTQSAVSQHVATLERQLGQELVLRGTRPAELSLAGRVLVGHGRAVLARLGAAERELAEVAGRAGRHLRLGCLRTALATFVPKAIAQLRTTVPQVSVSVTDDHMQGLLPRLLDRELDLAVVFDVPGGPEEYAGLELVPLFDDRYRLLVPRGHPLDTRSARPDLAALRDATWIGGGPRSVWFRPVAEACRSLGFRPAPSLTSDDHLAIQAFVAAGLGIAVVPGLAAARPLPGVRALELQGPVPTRRVAAARPEGAYLSESVSAMLRILRQVTRGY